MLGALIKKERIAQNMSQESLAHGICTPSYLSKIENGQVECSEAMIEQLFCALDLTYLQDEALLDTFQKSFQEYFEAYLHLEYSYLKEQHQVLTELAEQVRISPLAINSLLALALTTEKPALLAELEIYHGLFDEKQKLQYHIAKVQLLEKEEKHAEVQSFLLSILHLDTIGLFHGKLAWSYMTNGEYHRSLPYAQKAYDLYALQACIQGMYDMSHQMAFSHSNLFHLAEMEHYFLLSKRLQRYLPDTTSTITVPYNLGATYLCTGDYAKAKQYLEEAWNLMQENEKGDTDPWISQKLTFLYIHLGDLEQAKIFFAQIPDAFHVVLDQSKKLLSFMLGNPQYQHKEEYVQLLISCLELSEKWLHRGFVDFYARYLVEAFIAKRQYKRALEYTQKYNISQININ